VAMMCFVYGFQNCDLYTQYERTGFLQPTRGVFTARCEMNF